MPNIEVTARFEVKFTRTVTQENLEALSAETVTVAQLVDESTPYQLLRTIGTCEMAWDFAPESLGKPKPTRARRVQLKAAPLKTGRR